MCVCVRVHVRVHVHVCVCVSILSKVAYTHPVSPKDSKQDYLLHICPDNPEFLLEVV